MKKLLDILAQTANNLDKRGHLELANRLDSMIKSLANEAEENENEELEDMDYSTQRLRELREVLPEESQFEYPPGSWAEEEARGRDLEGEYQEAVEEKLQKEMEAEEEYRHWEQHMGDPAEASDNEEMLLEHGIVPIKGPKSNSARLGTGHFSTVYRAIHNDKEVAAKITSRQEFGSRLNDEAFVWNEILEIKDSLSEETQKHLPEIHDIITDQEYDRQIVLMEKLAPVPEKMLKAVGFWGASARRKMTDFFRNPETMNKAFEQATNFAYHELDRLSSSDRDLFHKVFIDYRPSSQVLTEWGMDRYEFKSEFRKYLYDGMVKAMTGAPAGLGKDMERIVQQNINQPWTAEYEPEPAPTVKEMEKNIDPERIKRIENVVEEMAEYAVPYIVAFEREAIPIHHEEEGEFTSEVMEEIPEARSFFKALKELAEHGIEYRDLHKDNVLMRPSTGELVIIDVGLYDAPAKPTRLEKFTPNPEGNYYGPEESSW